MSDGLVLSSNDGIDLERFDPAPFVAENRRCAKLLIDRLFAGTPIAIAS